MSGVWIFDKKGVARLIPNPTRESFELNPTSTAAGSTATAPGARPKALVYLPTNQPVTSFSQLEFLLTQLGWTRYYSFDDHHQPNLVQFHKSHCSSHLISLPCNFSNFKSFHMYDIVVQNPSFFQVRHLP